MLPGVMQPGFIGSTISSPVADAGRTGLVSTGLISIIELVLIGLLEAGCGPPH
jgi:hypothetical protein